MTVCSPHSQALQLPVLVIAGLLIGAAGMGFAGIRRLICAGFWLSLICDILMGILWGAIFCAGVAIADSGRLRLFHIIAVLCASAFFRAVFTLPVGKLISLASVFLTRCAVYVSKNRLLRKVFK